jgi:endonuclease/exonuclease/phosphatase family metal-dependent hydrolase
MDRLRLLTINIWNRQGPWDKRLALLRAGVRALDPDLIGVQEVLHLDGAGPDQADNLAADLGYHTVFGKAWAIWGGALDLGNALLSRWPIREHKNLALPVLDEEEEHRALLYALVEAPVGHIPVFVTHLSWRFDSADERALQIRSVDDHARELAPVEKTFPPILMGDFNAEPDSDEMRFMRGLTALGGRSTYWADTFHIAGDGPGHTFSRRNPYARQVHEPSRRIDYIFCRGPDRWHRGEPLAARVVLDQPEGDIWPSDHFGVYAEVSTQAVTTPPHDNP